MIGEDGGSLDQAHRIAPASDERIGAGRGGERAVPRRAATPAIVHAGEYVQGIALDAQAERHVGRGDVLLESPPQCHHRAHHRVGPRAPALLLLQPRAPHQLTRAADDRDRRQQPAPHPLPVGPGDGGPARPPRAARRREQRVDLVPIHVAAPRAPLPRLRREGVAEGNPSGGGAVAPDGERGRRPVAAGGGQQREGGTRLIRKGPLVPGAHGVERVQGRRRVQCRRLVEHAAAEPGALRRQNREDDRNDNRPATPHGREDDVLVGAGRHRSGARRRGRPQVREREGELIGDLGDHPIRGAIAVAPRFLDAQQHRPVA